MAQVQWVQVSRRHLHRQMVMKLYYVIFLRALAEGGKAKIAKALNKKVAKGKTDSEEAADAILGKITTGLMDKCADCDLIVEAAYEDLGVKHEMFKELRRYLQTRNNLRI